MESMLPKNESTAAGQAAEFSALARRNCHTTRQAGPHRAVETVEVDMPIPEHDA